MKQRTNLTARSLLGALVALGLVGSGATALAVPSVLSVQGQLSNATGQDGAGSYTLGFALYDAPEGGQQLWGEVHNTVEVIDGIFDVSLGTEALNPLLSSLFVDHPQVWLGVWVAAGPGVAQSGEDELPRQPLTTVGYAFAAQRAVTADGLSCTGCLSDLHLDFDPVTQAELEAALANFEGGGGVAITSVDGLTGGAIDGDVTVLGELEAGILYQGVNKVCDESGNCSADAVGALPPDALDAISNGLLKNVFDEEFAGSVKAIPDNNPGGVLDEVVVPDVGIVQTISVTVDITNADISGLVVTLFDPLNNQHVLHDKSGEGPYLSATYPDPDAVVSGDLSDWVGENATGTWRLIVADWEDHGGGDDGQINSWSVNIEYLSSKKIVLNGDLVAEDGKEDVFSGKRAN